MSAPAKKKYSKLNAVDINPGLQQVYPNPDEAAANRSFALEIVAIPGLGANPEWTWVREKVHWLRDSNMLARKVPNARISVLQYQSQWFGKGSIDQRLENVADQLLYNLERSRGDDCKTPIIFVSHCLGGIVLERALITARLRQNDFPTIFPWVAGCLFLGTPFHGTRSSNKAQVLAEMAETIGMGVSSSLIKLLEKDSDVLLRMLDEFVRLVNDAQIRVFCFFEAMKSDLAALFFKGLPFKTQELIVDKESATYPGVESLQLASDHFSLNKFPNSKDGNYVIVSNEIQQTAKKAAGIIKARQNANRQALVNDRTYHAMIDTLGKGFSDLDATVRGTYKGPKSEKSSWIIDVDQYKRWKEQNDANILWIHGKAGTGQGAIASSVIESLKNTRDPGSVVTSFFCDQGDENRRTLKGLLRVIVRQVVDLRQNLAVHLLTDTGKSKKTGIQDFDPESLSKASVLWEALQAMAKDLPSGCIYIVLYGVDQMSQDSLKELFQCLRDFEQPEQGQENHEGTRIKLVILSRSGRPDIEKALKPKALEINIDDSEHAEQISDALRQDISLLVDELRMPPPLSYFVKRHVHSRAEDNYIYVNLVIQELKNVRDFGNAGHAAVRGLLESFPYGLTDMFEHVRKRVLDPNAEGIEYTKEIFRCLILARRAPTMRELGVMAGLPVGRWDDLESLRHHIVRCGAFLTLRGNELDEDGMTVEWIDISAQEHLEKYAKDDLALDLKDMQHGIIALRCLNYVYGVTENYDSPAPNEDAEGDEAPQEDDQVEPKETEATLAKPEAEDLLEPVEPLSPIPIGDNEDHHEDDEKAESDGKSDVDEDVDNQPESTAVIEAPQDPAGNDYQSDVGPLDTKALTYPVEYWIEHAKLAPVDVIEEFRTAHSFWKDDSPARQDWWSQNEWMHAEPNHTNVTSLHVATISGFSVLVEHLLKYGWEEDLSKEDSLGLQPLYYAATYGYLDIVQTLLGAGADPNALSPDGRVAALFGAARASHIDIVECLLDRDAEINTPSEDYGTPLYAATEEDSLDIMRLLIKRGAEVNIPGGWHKRALNVAAFNGNLEAVQLLLDKGADIDPDDEYWYGSALGAAARRGHADVAKILLSKGWTPSKKMETYGSFLTAAATYGHIEVVNALLQKEERITVLEQALMAASQNGKEKVVKAILDRTPTLRHQQAFKIAADYGRDEVLKLLFPRGIAQNVLNNALYKASDHEHEETVKLLLNFGADPNAEGDEYGTALTASAYDGTTGILQALLAKSADVNKRGGDYGTALQAAALCGDAENVKLLIEHGAEVNTEDIGLYGNPLQAGCYTGNMDTIKILLEHGADVNAKGGKYSYAIIAAADEGDSEALKLLLEHDANINVSGLEDNDPLISIVGATLPKEDMEAVLEAGADINAQCNKGATALINCANAGDTDSLEFLLSRGANIHISATDTGTALHAAAAQGDEDCCKILLKAGADVNAIGGEMGTALQAAADAADLETVEVLLDASADVNLEAGLYGTALQAAAFTGQLDVVQKLLDHDAEVNHLAKGSKYGCALQAASYSGNKDIVELLLEHGADVNLEGGTYSFPLLAGASLPGNDDIVNLLLDHGAIPYAQGGLLGSAIQAACFGNNVRMVELLIDRGADVHVKGGKYGSCLQVAAITGNEELIDVLLAHNVDVNYRGGKYDTSLQAAAYAGHLNIVEELLDHNADFRTKGGIYGNVLTAAAIHGNRAVLEHFLKLDPPEPMLDEALIQACYYRQPASVEALLKSGANVLATHPDLGRPVDALKTEAPDAYNSDDEQDDEEDEDDDDDDNEDEDDDEDDEDEQWEGDDKSVAGETEGSVQDLQLEEELSDEAKIQKLLDEAMARVKRNPSVKRFKTVKRSNLPASLTAGGSAPRQAPSQSYGQPKQTVSNAPYTQQPYTGGHRQSFQAYPSGSQQGYQLPRTNSGYTAYGGSLQHHPIQGQVQNPQPPPKQAAPTEYAELPAQHYNSPRPISQFQASPSPPKQGPPSGYAELPAQMYQPKPPAPPLGYQNPPALPSRPGSQESRGQRMQPTGQDLRSQDPRAQYAQTARQSSFPSPQAQNPQQPPSQYAQRPPMQQQYSESGRPSYGSPLGPQQQQPPPPPGYRQSPPSQQQQQPQPPPGYRQPQQGPAPTQGLPQGYRQSQYGQGQPPAPINQQAERPARYRDSHVPPKLPPRQESYQNQGYPPQGPGQASQALPPQTRQSMQYPPNQQHGVVPQGSSQGPGQGQGQRHAQRPSQERFQTVRPQSSKTFDDIIGGGGVPGVR